MSRSDRKEAMFVPRRSLAALVATVGLLFLSACTSAPEGSGSPSGASSSSAPASGAPSSSVVAPEESASNPGQSATVGSNQVIINITLMNGTVQPNGQKIDVTRGQDVLLNVVSDHADEVHVHGDYDIELEVPANTPVSKSFVADKSGSVEVESHHPEKIIAILNVR